MKSTTIRHVTTGILVAELLVALALAMGLIWNAKFGQADGGAEAMQVTDEGAEAMQVTDGDMTRWDIARVDGEWFDTDQYGESGSSFWVSTYVPCSDGTVIMRRDIVGEGGLTIAYDAGDRPWAAFDAGGLLLVTDNRLVLHLPGQDEG